MISLCRILGNDLPPRHRVGQTYDNLRWIVENEYPFEDTHKWWVVNRIVDEQQEELIVDYLKANGLSYTHLKISDLEYQTVLPEHRAQWLTNLNPMRNYCISMVRDVDVCLPLDGNCFFRLDGWLRTVSSFDAGCPYVVIQMARVEEYPDPAGDEVPSWFENYRWANRITTAATEPQIGFIEGFDVKYDEALAYGSASKLGLLYQIGVRGVWDNWYPELKAKMMMNQSKFYGHHSHGGWCYRLPSGVPEAEADNQLRAASRTKGIAQLVERANRKFCR